jgi:enoyl-CoA hydratase/carnithine racemase
MGERGSSPPSCSEIRLDIDGAVATVTLDRPARRNAWTVRMANELSAAMRWCDGCDSVQAVVVTGAGRWFSVGADLSEGSIDQPGAGDEAIDEQVLPSAIGVPVIAAINGDAVGAGTTYPLHCDIRIVAETARLGLPFVRRGVIPEMGAHWLAPRLLGQAVAADLVLTGRLVDGREAVRLGLCSRAVPAEEVVATARRVATEIAESAAPVAVATAKRLLWEGASQGYDEALAAEQDAFGSVARHPDAAEGVASFLERRPPRWVGHRSELGARRIIGRD